MHIMYCILTVRSGGLRQSCIVCKKWQRKTNYQHFIIGANLSDMDVDIMAKI